MTNNNIRVPGNWIKLLKIGWVDFAAEELSIPNSIVNVTATDIDGQVLRLEPLPSASEGAASGRIALDMALNQFTIPSEGEPVESRVFCEGAEKAGQTPLQRQPSKKEKGSNTAKRRAVAGQHEKITNQRKDFVHKQSKRLVV